MEAAESSEEFPQPFSDDFDIVASLGEGAYGEVRLLKHRWTAAHPLIALKRIRIAGRPDAEKVARKEAEMMRYAGRCGNVIELLTSRETAEDFLLFLEYADGGELFDRIEPDVGLGSAQAQRWFSELLSGLAYLHSRGIAHRDLKPENCLLAGVQDTLKICDFGLATLFRRSSASQKRLSKSRCGTMQYAAPEVLAFKEGSPVGFDMEAADVWAVGVVLVAMLTGELPWDRALPDNEAFAAWKEKVCLEAEPWRRLDNLALSLLRRVLQPSPELRASLERLREHPWLAKDFGSEESNENLWAGSEVKSSAPDHGASQPPKRPRVQEELSISTPKASSTGVWFSQPVNLGALLVSQDSLSPASQLTQNMSPMERIGRRMTRLWTHSKAPDALRDIADILATLRLDVAQQGSSQLTARGRAEKSWQTPVVFRVLAIRMPAALLLDFRLVQGDGLEFKRLFGRAKREAERSLAPGWLCGSPNSDRPPIAALKGSGNNDLLLPTKPSAHIPQSDRESIQMAPKRCLEGE